MIGIDAANTLFVSQKGRESDDFKFLSGLGLDNLEIDRDKILEIAESASAVVEATAEAVVDIVDGCDMRALFSHVNFYSRVLLAMRSHHNEGDASEREYVAPIEWNDAFLIPDYLHSVVVSYRVKPGNKQLPEEEFSRLIGVVKDCIRKCRLCNIANTAVSSAQIGSVNLSDSLLPHEEHKLFEIRGKRYKSLEIPYHDLLLSAQDELIKCVLGIGADKIVLGLERIMQSLIFGPGDAIEAVGRDMDRYAKNEGQLSDKERNYCSANMDKLLGLGLNDVGKITGWPIELLDELSLGIGDNNWNKSSREFAENPNPLGVLPVFYKPFLKIEDRYYCLSEIDLLDYFYRALYRALRNLSNKKELIYRGKRLTDSFFVNLWKENQTKASECGVSNLFGKLLPGCEIHQNCFLPKEGKKLKPSNLRESDLVIKFDDVVIVVEVKGGAYVLSDPVMDASAHGKSLNKVIGEGRSQAYSTVQYINSSAGGVATFYDKDCSRVFGLSIDSVRECYGISVSVDELTELAARADKIESLNSYPGIISISLSDLMTYCEYFDNPFIFLHYLEQRSKATQCPLIAFNDELDHLGAYIKYGRYVDFAHSFGGEFGRVEFDGLRNDLDDWFEGAYLGAEGLSKPVQDMPKALEDILRAISDCSSDSGRSEAASFFLNLDRGQRGYIAERLERFWISGSGQNIGLNLLSDFETCSPISIYRAAPGLSWDKNVCLDKVKALMLDEGEKRRVVLFLQYGSHDEPPVCETVVVSSSDFDGDTIARLDPLRGKSKAVRATNFRETLGRKIGRNEPCPCGSGKKFKKCCGR